MELTKRQSKILNCIVQEYVQTKEPISSKLLAKKYKFGIKAPTMRLEFQKLTDAGFLMQPHTSAGRIPTDSGYRFYVDTLEPKNENRGLNPIEKDIQDSFKFFQEMTKKMADLTSNLALSYFPDEDIFFKEGWDHLFKEPEFENTDIVSQFTKMVENMEKEIENFDDCDFPQIFIGKENPILEGKEFSVIISKIHISNKKDGVVALMGPKRMDYGKNVKIINSLTKQNVRKRK